MPFAVMGDHESVSAKASWDAELYEAKHSFVWKLGQGVVDLLDPKPGERILDLGCGTGHLTDQIAQRGAEVVGIDASPDMIGQARQNFPQLRFHLENAGEMKFEDEFDAVFSNAALHWMTDAGKIAAAISHALRRNGRLVAELGGRRNIGHIEDAIESVLSHFETVAMPKSRTYFPSIGEYGAILDANGLEVRFAQLFDRPTPLEGTNGMEDWIRQFKWYYFEQLPPERRRKALDEVLDVLRPILWREDGWIADYRRLRVVAIKL
jgi:trans-aconitate 2-methyltransferase